MSTSSIPLWGQAWELVVYYATADGFDQTTITSSAWEPEALRMTFDVLQAMNKTPVWYADISIYNMEAAAAKNLAANATWATLSAGFQTGPSRYAIIWNGRVFQTLFTQENIVDQKLTLHCVAVPNSTNLLPQGFSMGQSTNQQQLIQNLISGANLPPLSPATQGAAAQQRMLAVQYPRGNTVFGTLPAYLAQTAEGHGLQTWFNGLSVSIAEVDDGTRTPSLIYSPPFPPGNTTVQSPSLPDGTTQSIIGTPEQTQQGVNFTVLLDPRLTVGLPPLVVQIVRTQITQLVRTPSPTSELAPPIAANLVFFVAQVRHTGDTRGNDWQTEVTGWSTSYANSLLTTFGAA